MQLHLHFMIREFVYRHVYIQTAKQKVEETFVSPSNKVYVRVQRNDELLKLFQLQKWHAH